MISLRDKKAINNIKQTMDVKLNSFGLKIRRLENENIILRNKVGGLENDIYSLKNSIKGEQ